MTKRTRQSTSPCERKRCPVQQELENNSRITQFNRAPVSLENRSVDDEILHTIFSSLSSGIWLRLLDKVDNNDNIYENLGIPECYLVPFFIKTKIFKVYNKKNVRIKKPTMNLLPPWQREYGKGDHPMNETSTPLSSNSNTTQGTHSSTV